jgi:hypothetical protein
MMLAMGSYRAGPRRGQGTVMGRKAITMMGMGATAVQKVTMQVGEILNKYKYES